ncbi:MAG: phosphotransferase family protein [Pseudomonadota bacterium]
MRSLNLDWLNQFIPADIADFSLTPMEHYGLQGSLSFLDLEFAGPSDLPGRWVVKRAGGGELEVFSHALGCFEREVEAYKRGQEYMGVPMLMCLHADYDSVTRDMIIVLEDISHLRDTRRHHTETMRIDDAVRRAETYAALHAPRWNDPSLAREDWLFDLRSVENKGFEMLITDIPTMVQTAIVRHERLLNDYLLTLFEHLLDYDRLKERLPLTPATLIHGDANGGNSVFRGDELILMDWALAAHGAPGTDLAWILHHETDGATAAIDATVNSYRAAMKRYNVPMTHREVIDLLRHGAVINLIAEIERWLRSDDIPTEAEPRARANLNQRALNYRHIGLEKLLA